MFLGAIFEGALRFIITWYLSGALGPEGFGVYTSAVTVVTVVALASPLGVNIGILYYGARWLQAKDRPRLKGYLLAGLGVVLVTGPTLALLLAAMGLSGRFWADKPGVSEAMVLIAPAVAVVAVLLYLVFAVRSAKDMKRSTLAMQIMVPAGLLVGVVAVTQLGLGLKAVIVAFVVSNVLAMLGAAAAAWKHFGTLLLNRAVKPAFELGAMLRYSLPQAVPAIIYRLNLQMDILMLLALGTIAELGIYRVAVSLVVMVVMPVGAISTMFSPQVAQLYHGGHIDRLDALLKVATRWLVIVVAPIYLVLILEHRAILGFYEPEYMASASAILVLAAGQSVHAIGAPANRLIPMSGRAVLDMGLSIAAVCLNITLNLLLIPRFGGLGAAMAGATTFATWGVTRIFVAWKLTTCHPFTPRTVALVAGAIVLGALVWLFAPEQPWLHAGCTACAIVAFGGLVLLVGRTPQDTELLMGFRDRLARMVGLAR